MESNNNGGGMASEGGWEDAVWALGALGDSWVVGGVVETWEEFQGSLVHPADKLIRWGWVTGVQPHVHAVQLGVAVVVDGVGVVVGVHDVKVWLLVGLSEEDNIAGGV